MSLKSFFQKKHVYNTQADLEHLSAEEIVRLDPRDVSSHIETETGGHPLQGVKRRAMNVLVALKRENKKRPNAAGTERAIANFLTREGLQEDSEVSQLIAKTTDEMLDERLKEANETMKSQLRSKDLENRLRRLKNEPTLPDTKEEAIFRRTYVLKAGNRSRTGKRKAKKNPKKSERAGGRSRTSRKERRRTSRRNERK